MELRIREVDEGGAGLTGTRASEAKGPFPGGKRVGSWGKKAKEKRKRPTQRSGMGLKALRRGLGVGKKVKVKVKAKKERVDMGESGREK